MKFLVDMPLSPDLAAWLREQGYDAVHAVALQLDRAPNVEILRRANLEGRTVITADLDYPRLLALAGNTDASLILFRNGNWSDAAVIARMTEILKALTPADITGSIMVVDRTRVRRRKLPISG